MFGLNPGDLVTVIIAHCDDESLFCGGTLLKLREHGCRLRIVVCSSIATCNAPPKQHSKERETLRQERRRHAFLSATGQLRAESHILNLANLPAHVVEAKELIDDRIAELRHHLRPLLTGLVISHGRAGEYGHSMHKAVHQAVADEMTRPWLGFDLSGEVSVNIDRAAKLKLLELYKVGTTQQPTWEPLKLYPEWVTGTERFTWYGNQPCAS